MTTPPAPSSVVAANKRALEDSEALLPPLKKPKLQLETVPATKLLDEDQNDDNSAIDVPSEYTIRCEIVHDDIDKADMAKLRDEHLLVLSNLYRTECETDQPLIEELQQHILQYSTFNPMLWSTEFKGRNLCLNASKRVLFATECDVNESCRSQEPFPKGKISRISFQYHRNDECCFQASFIGVHCVGMSRFANRNMYSHSPLAPTTEGTMYRGAINRISYGILECGGWVDPNTTGDDDIDYGVSFSDGDVIVMEADFTNDKQKKLRFFLNDKEQPLMEKTLRYFGSEEMWYPAVGFGSGES
eukprot:CAMPEP_0202713630 /NCGR_PEP_ID=MMETSP1385-20130828/57130_1 /ASSEMBLY_ACC=CAM_ASM_000861 /TAXON_ID=933848 /ORGANISM="Elphidium margaritaceum" /LENGTH=301 /DNA_ID=CAMNT_0049374047 /DNA_START=31 /DNA_END=936 /DNA_ORIENTATION=-